jgi:hypothetical protein
LVDRGHFKRLPYLSRMSFVAGFVNSANQIWFLDALMKKCNLRLV